MNRTALRLTLLATLLVSIGAYAQSAPPPPASIPPPPDFDRPLRPRAQPAQPPLPAPAASTLRQSLAPTLPPHNPMGQPPPTVKVRKVKGNVVEEYRAGGKLIMVRIIPAHGPIQTFYANTEGRLQPNPGQGPVAPVFYTLYQWGH